MSLRTSSRVRNPSTKLIEANAPPDPTPSETSSIHVSKRRKVDTTTKTTGKKTNGKVNKVDTEQVEELEEDEDPDRLYCVCKEKYKAGVKMIQCNHCHDWFHFKCVKLTQSQASQIHSYICPTCNEESGGVLKSIRTSDISLLQSPPGSKSPRDSQSKTKRGKTTATAARSAKGKRKNADNGVVSDIKTEDAASENDESTSSSSSSDDNSSGDSAGSGDEAWVTKKKSKKDGKGYRTKRGKAAGTDDENSETDSDGVAETPLDGSSTRSRSYSVDHSVKRGAQSAKRKSSGAATQSAKRRRSSVVAAAPEPKSGIEAGKDFPMRKYCVNKLIPVLEGIFLQYYKEATEAASRPQEQDDGKMDVDGDAVLAPADEAPAKLLSEAEVKKACYEYAEEVELALFNHYKEYSIDKKMMVPGARYKAQFSLVHSSLDKNLRPDLRRGIATSTILPSRLAIMDSNDLATEDQLKERRRLEAESMKSLVRSDDAYSQIKYTKKGLEDSETLQRIQNNISRKMDHDPKTPKAESERGGTEELSSERRPSVTSLAGEPSTPSRETPSAALKSPTRTPATVTLDAGPSRPIRQSSFSLSAVLGTGAASTMDYGDESVEEEDDVLPGFGFADAPSGGADDTFYLASDDGNDKAILEDHDETPAEVVTADDEFRQLPVVWTGHILNPADPDNSPPLVEGRQIGGRDLSFLPQMWPMLIPHDPIHLVGRVPTKDSAKYLLNCRLSPTKELVIVAFTPKNEEERARFDALNGFHKSRGRHGVSTPYSHPPPGAPKEVYIVPLSPGDNYEFLDLMDRYLLPEERTMDVLLGVFIIPKSREEVTMPPTASSALPPAVVSTPNAIPGIGGTDLSSLLASLKPEAIQSMLAASNPQHPSMPPFPPSMPPTHSQSYGHGHGMPPPFNPSADGNHMSTSTPHGLTPVASASPPVHPSRMRLISGPAVPQGQERGHGQQGHDNRYPPHGQGQRWDRWER